MILKIRNHSYQQRLKDLDNTLASHKRDFNATYLGVQISEQIQQC